MEKYFDLFIGGVVLVLLIKGVPALVSLGRKKKGRAIEEGKVYYGLLWGRIFAFFVLGIISAEMVLLSIFGDSISGWIAFLMTFLVAIPITVVYVRVYRKLFIKKYFTDKDDVV